jgi:hypothetical protein
MFNQFAFLIPIAIFVTMIVLILMLATAFRRKPRKEKIHMIKSIYFYAISFITLIMVIGGGVSLFMAASDYVTPATSIMNQTDWQQNQKSIDSNPENKTATLTDAQWQAKYEAYKTSQKDIVKNQALNSLVKSLGWIIIPAPIFLYTQRRIREIKVEV